MGKKLLLAALVILIGIQFIRPEPNEGRSTPFDIKHAYSVPEPVARVLQVACNDCHSNKTQYPWYAKVQPVAWWLDGHIQEGKEHLNFSEFTRDRLAVQNHKFEEIIEMVEEGEMPLHSYTYLGLHKEANLSEAEKELLIRWAKDQMEGLAQKYPADSLILRR